MATRQPHTLRRRVNLGCAPLVSPARGSASGARGSSVVSLRQSLSSRLLGATSTPPGQFCGIRLDPLRLGTRRTVLEGSPIVDCSLRASDGPNRDHEDMIALKGNMQDASGDASIVSEHFQVLKPDADGKDASQLTTEPISPATVSSNGAAPLTSGSTETITGVRERQQTYAPNGRTSPRLSSDNGGGVDLAESDGGAWLPQRWKVTLMMGLAFILCNMDKVNMSVAVIPMAHDLGWSATSRGIVQSAFFWGYTMTQIPAGWMSTRVGGSMVLLCGVALWSLATVVAPCAAHYGFWLLCTSRLLVGLGEGLAPSAATSVLARQIPATERSRAVATVFGGLDLGSAIGLLLCGPLIKAFGWPCVFYLFGMAGLMWSLMWQRMEPEGKDAIAMAKAVQETKKPVTNGLESNAKVPWGQFFRSGPVLAVTIAHFCFNWGYYTLLSWLPSFFELALNLNVQLSSFLTVIPYIAMTAMTPLVGPAADALVAQGVSITAVRKLAQGLAFLGPALCMVGCGMLVPQGAVIAGGSSSRLIVSLLSVAFALGAWSRAGLYCNHQDLSPRFASALLGISNTAGAIPGILGVWSTGYLLDVTGSWSKALFYPIAAFQLMGVIIYSVFGSSRRQAWS